ncbi:MAG: tryptophan 7-halogenase, partial [Acidobacteriota bacterium]|nr:tryptophan 7-halogenase [Acidobacteriota bacterium]
GGPRPFENDFLFNPYGCGWHVNRPAFDRMLAEAARRAGAGLLLGTTVQRMTEGAGGRWVIETKRGAGRARLTADHVVWAGGRAAGTCGSARRTARVDRLVGCAAFFDQSDVSDAAETRAVIEARPEGWWYTSILPGGVLVAALMTDADLVPGGHDRALEYVGRRLRETELTGRRLTRAATPRVFRRFAADTRWSPAVSAKLVAVGDAAMTFDPLSSQGVFKALASGLSAARGLIAARSGNEEALREYADAMARDFQSYMQTRSQYYRAEQRWPASPFWRRRHHPAGFSAVTTHRPTAPVN